MKGFSYDKFKEEMNNNDSWGSYSDLFMVLSFIFLMMYVVASLRSGTNSIQQRLEQQRVARENDDLRAQMKAYDTLKDQALRNESESEQVVYEELMNKLDLLKDEAKEEKNRLRKQAQENEKKEMALNRYQQIVRNIINANLLAKNKLDVREKIIDSKNIKIADLNEELQDKKEEIQENNQQIVRINQELRENIQKLNKSQLQSKISKKLAMQKIEDLKEKSEKEIQKLNKMNQMVKSQISEITEKLTQTNEQLAEKESENRELSENLEETTEKLETTVAQYNQQIENIENQHQERMKKEKQEFEEKLKNLKMTATQKAQELARFNQMAKLREQKVKEQVAALESQIKDAQTREAEKDKENQMLSQSVKDNLQKLEKEKQRAEENIKKAAEIEQQKKEQEKVLGTKIGELKSSLAEAQARADARKKLAAEIAKALKAAGVDANVNGGTGDVTISFDGDYFDNGSAKLKPTMAEVLKRFVPKYSETLFKDKSIADKITSVDIIGFASPTYGGKFIDPQSLTPDDQKAAKYNLDLSYQRARSIFDYMFDEKKISYKNQKDLIPLVKVTGRSFFANGRAPAGAKPGMSQKEFCQKFDCKQSQKVIIKFNMDDKK